MFDGDLEAGWFFGSLFVVGMVLFTILTWLGIAWVVAKIFIRRSKDKSRRHFVKIMVITLAILILPSYVILPVAAGIVDKIKHSSDQRKYEQCVNDNTNADSPAPNVYRSEEAYEKIKHLDPLYICYNLKPL